MNPRTVAYTEFRAGAPPGLATANNWREPMTLTVKSLALAAGLALSLPSLAHITTFTGTFGPEVTGATGSGSLTLEYDEDGHTIFINATFAGLSGNTTNAHIHCCNVAPLTTSGVALGNSAVANNMLLGFPVGVKSGTFTAVVDLTQNTSFGNAFRSSSPAVGSFAAGTAGAAEVRLINGLINKTAYFNIHSSTFGGGEIRAFVAVVPEPQTYALMLAGLAGVLTLARRKKQA
jgi:CHRD domain/PEP-CTERM motif